MADRPLVLGAAGQPAQLTGDLDHAGGKATNAADPTADTDLTTRGWVKGNVGAVGAVAAASANGAATTFARSDHAHAGVASVAGIQGTAAATGALTLLVAPTATANRGLLSLGDGPFDGVTAGFFAGNAAGTVIAINVTGTALPFVAQKSGATLASITNAGTINLAGAVVPGSLGTAGAPCKLWAGTGVPPNALGANGDYYLRTDAGAATHLYFRAAGVYAAVI